MENFIAVKEQVKHTWNLQLYVAGHPSESPTVYSLFEKYKDDSMKWIKYPNLPLSQKWNALLKQIKDCEYVFITGSDDLFNAQLFHTYYPLVQAGHDYLGLLSSYFLELATMKLILWKGYTNHRRGEPDGGGRLIRTDIIARNNYKLWDDRLNKGLDGSMTRRLAIADKPKFIRCEEHGILFVDIKSGFNICPFSSFEGESMDVEILKELPAWKLIQDSKLK